MPCTVSHHHTIIMELLYQRRRSTSTTMTLLRTEHPQAVYLLSLEYNQLLLCPLILPTTPVHPQAVSQIFVGLEVMINSRVIWHYILRVTFVYAPKVPQCVETRLKHRKSLQGQASAGSRSIYKFHPEASPIRRRLQRGLGRIRPFRNFRFYSSTYHLRQRPI